MKFQDEPLLILDGACGSSLQQMNLPAEAWCGKEGCYEALNISAPEAVIALHKQFIDAGAMVLETNTFGASRIVLAEYGLEDRVAEINTAAVKNARAAIDERRGKYVIGSIGPTTKLPSLGHIPVDALAQAVAEQAQALVKAGVDALILETCQDLLQIKTALVACLEVCDALAPGLPILVSVTIEQQGTMLVGSDVAAVATALAPYPIFSLGLNCATGPDAMVPHILYLSGNWEGRVSCVPNQGLPEVVDGKTIYPLTPEPFATQMRRFVETHGVSIVGGCCGTSPAHIAALVTALDGVVPMTREVSR